jgi:hypothetical protein
MPDRFLRSEDLTAIELLILTHPSFGGDDEGQLVSGLDVLAPFHFLGRRKGLGDEDFLPKYGSELIYDVGTWARIDAFYLSLVPLQLDHFVRVLFEQVSIMMADHQHLKTERSACVVNDLYQLWYQVRSQPAILFVEKQKATMRFLVECGQTRTCANRRSQCWRPIHLGQAADLPFCHFVRPKSQRSPRS